MNNTTDVLHRGWIVVADIVKFSKKSDVVQRDVATFLVKAVETTYLFRHYLREKTGFSLLCTGDGFILVVAESLVAQPSQFLRFAEEIQRAVSTYENQLSAYASSKATEDDKRFAIRMGVHDGHFYFEDIVGQHNAIGTGINHAARVAGCGDGGHILTSDTFHRLLFLDPDQLGSGQVLLNLGELRIKHGVRIPVYNYTRVDLDNKSRVLSGKQERPAVAEHQHAIDTYICEHLGQIEGAIAKSLVGKKSDNDEIKEKDLGLRLTVLVPSEAAPPDWKENKHVVPTLYRFIRGDPEPRQTDVSFETDPPRGVSARAFVTRQAAMITMLPRRYEEEDAYITALAAENLQRDYIRTIVRPCRAFIAVPFQLPITKAWYVLTLDALHPLFDQHSQEMTEVVKSLTSHTRNLAELLELTVS